MATGDLTWPSLAFTHPEPFGSRWLKWKSSTRHCERQLKQAETKRSSSFARLRMDRLCLAARTRFSWLRRRRCVHTSESCLSDFRPDTKRERTRLAKSLKG